jgi:two-component system repressor protein LuxO
MDMPYYGAEILLVEDSPSTAMAYQSYLEEDHKVVLANTGQEALEQLSGHDFDMILLDVRLPDMSGLDILEKISNSKTLPPVVVMTSHGSVDVAVEAMRLGAADFLTKPFDKARLMVTVKNILKGKRLVEIVDDYEKTVSRESFHEMIGSCLPMQTVYHIIETASSSKASIFITGESGTGKELCATAIHKESKRKDKPFVALNCASIPRDLLESEIFGHVKGAFTGASSSRDGAALNADGGTLFLDELCELPLDLQSKLLRFIQFGTFQPVGSNKDIKVDVRFVCATNREPLDEIEKGNFREDLYYRLNVIPLQLPSLRERGRDVLMIAERILKQYSKEEGKQFEKLSAEVANKFLAYSWPGNVRELCNVLRNIVVLNDGFIVDISMLPSALSDSNAQANVVTERGDLSNSIKPIMHGAKPSYSSSDEIGGDTIEPFWIEEKRIIERAVELCNGNIPKAAAFLEISASTIYRKKAQWDKQLQTH